MFVLPQVGGAVQTMGDGVSELSNLEARVTHSGTAADSLMLSVWREWNRRCWWTFSKRW